MGRTQPSEPDQRRGIHSHGPMVTTTSSAWSALSCCGHRVAQSAHPEGTSSSVLLGPNRMEPSRMRPHPSIVRMVTVARPVAEPQSVTPLPSAWAVESPTTVIRTGRAGSVVVGGGGTVVGATVVAAVDGG